MSLVAVENVTKIYHLGKTQITALKDVHFEVAEGEFVSVVGPSGSGKTTLLNLMGCLDQPTSGIVRIEDQEVEALSSNQLAELRAERIGFIFQAFNLIPVLSAAENVEYPLLQKRGTGSGNERRAKVHEILESVGMGGLSHHRPNELSAGEQQRVAVARALVTNPNIVLADEPTANLDHEAGGIVINLMKTLNKERGITFIFATHDPEIVRLAERVIPLRDGEVVEQ